MNRDLDPLLEHWLADGPTRVPDRVVRGAMDRIASASQESLAVTWGFHEMSGLMRLAVVAVLAVAVGGFLWGGPRLLSVGGAPAVSPAATPSPTPSPVTIQDEGTDVLATTRARPLPSQATCPPGGDPDAPGPADQERPAAGVMALDRHAGRIVLLAGEEVGSRTWTYDLCTNTWQRMSPAEEPVAGWGSPGPARLVYDADSDRTLAFGEDMRIWSYELAADRWTEVGSLPWAETEGVTLYGTIFYHDPSGLVVAYDGVAMWAYDVETRSLTKVRQRPDPSQPAGSGLPQGKVALGYDPVRDLVIAVVVPYAGVPDDPTGSNPSLPGRYRVPQGEWGETWTFDPGTGAWRREPSPARSDLIVCGVWWKGSTECYQTYGRAVFDEASGLTVFMTRDFGKPAHADRVDAFDAGLRAWRTLRPSATETGGRGSLCASTPPVYDPLNERIVCQAGGQLGDELGADLVAFSTASGEWGVLLGSVPPAGREPDASSPQEP